MNSAYSLFALVGFFFGTSLGASANGLVQFPSGPAAWTIDVTDSTKNTGSQKLGNSAIQKVEVAQNERFSRHVVTYFSGDSRMVWGVTGTNLVMTEDPKGTAFLTPVTKYFFIPYLPSVFDWLSPTLLQEKDPITYHGKMCFHYKGPQAEAWIDSKTLLPVALDDGTGLSTFTFHGPPDQPLVLPPKYKTVLDAYIGFMGVPHTQRASN